MQDQKNLTPQRCLKILCLFRFLHPRTELRVAGGREFNLRALQALALYPADSLFVGGYLTTPGMPAPEAWKMIEDLGFEVDTVGPPPGCGERSEEHTSELQSRLHLVCRLLLE